jgi:hypothetical protein
MANICESKVPIDQLRTIGVCDECYNSFITRTTAIEVPNTPADTKISLIPSLRYRICLKPLGFGLGRHLYSQTLLPGEEIELEVFRSSKVAEELSKEFSVEETFAQETSSTIQNEWSNKQSSNYKIGGGVSASLDLGIFSIGGHVEPEYSTQEETFQKTFGEFVSKSQAKTDRKFDTHIGLKTETVSTTRSTRKIRNFNQCQPVTYNFFQLMRKMRTEMIIDSITFDVITSKETVSPVLTATLGGLLNTARFTPPRSQEILSALPGPVIGTGSNIANAAIPAAVISTPPTSFVAQATVLHSIVADNFDRPMRQLTRDQLELAIASMPPDQQKAVRELADRLISKFPIDKVVFSKEFCVNTNGMTVEAFTGRCLACDTHTALTQQTEREKARADLLKTKLAAVATATVFGFVQTAEGPVSGAVVQLRFAGTVVGSPGPKIFGETITDSDGLYILSAKGLAGPGDSLIVEAIKLPTGLSKTSPANAQFKRSDAPVQVDFVAS